MINTHPRRCSMKGWGDDPLFVFKDPDKEIRPNTTINTPWGVMRTDTMVIRLMSKQHGRESVCEIFKV